MDELTIDVTQNLSEYKTSQHNFPYFCIYETNSCGEILFNSNGRHLLVCEDFHCGHKYFKCPRNYCIPWGKVCNGKWECPGGIEERNCSRTHCPGQFKCHNAKICVAIQDICDAKDDCPLQDDENFCDYQFPSCPDKCTCLLFMISCDYLVSFHLIQGVIRFPYVSVQLINTEIPFLSDFLNEFHQLLLIQVKRNLSEP